MSEEKVWIIGINGVTGEYLVPPVEQAKIGAVVRGEVGDPDLVRWLRRIWGVISRPHLGLPMDVDPADVGQAGWAIVFHEDEAAAVKDALEPLIAHRRAQIGQEKVKVLDYRSSDTWRAWLARNGIAPGTVDPAKVPYYVLLVGDPTQIPYRFQHLLDVEYAVGRLSFDTPAEYGRYADSVVEYESAASVPHDKRAVFWATRHAFDRATQLSADLLVNPLADGIPATGSHPAQPGVADRWGYGTLKLSGNDATKANLEEVFRGKPGTKQPAFLFTASHGVGFPQGHPDQLAAQGALVCQDWPGFGQIRKDHYLASADLPDDARIHGLIAFHFACYGAGTPQRDSFFHEPGKAPPDIADQPFVASLPKRLLAHPQGGALATIGHVERAWGYSIVAPQAGPQIQPFQNAIGRILVGQPVGYAAKDFNERYAALSTNLSGLLEEISFGAQIGDDELARTWTERNDAQNYAVVGDPAVRLRVGDMG
ncbi:MAG: hypothetical protein P8189_16245 [Anaerolineae bacterium]